MTSDENYPLQYTFVTLFTAHTSICLRVHTRVCVRVLARTYMYARTYVQVCMCATRCALIGSIPKSLSEKSSFWNSKKKSI